MEQKGDLSERVVVGGTRRAGLSIADVLGFSLAAIVTVYKE